MVLVDPPKRHPLGRRDDPQGVLWQLPLSCTRRTRRMVELGRSRGAEAGSRGWTGRVMWKTMEIYRIGETYVEIYMEFKRNLVESYGT